MSQTTSITLFGIELEVDFSYTPPELGTRNSMGVPETPDFPAEIDIIEVYHKGEEILCLMDYNAISKCRDLVLAQGRE